MPLGSVRRLSLVLCSGPAMLAHPALAQDAAIEAGANPIRICGAAWASSSGEVIDKGARTVQALCWGTWLVLGRADEFRVAANPELEATIVELDRAGEPTVLLIRPDVQGRPFIENLGSALASAAGRTPLSGLDGLAFDYERFAFTGEVGIAPDTARPDAAPIAKADRSAAASSELGGEAIGSGSAVLEVGDHIAQDRARLAATGTQ